MTDKPLRRSKRRPARPSPVSAGRGSQRYKRLPTGRHGLDPQQVQRDQRTRLHAAMIELIAAKGYPAVRIADLAKLAHVSPPTLYSLYADKEKLFMGTYEDIARMVGGAILGVHDESASPEHRLRAAMRAFAELAAAQPQAISLLVLGAFGAGPNVLRKRRAALEALEGYIHATRDPGAPFDPGDLTVMALLGGIREVTAARLRAGRHEELPGLVDSLAGWTERYPLRLPTGLSAPVAETGTGGVRNEDCDPAPGRRAEGRLPSGRSDLPRSQIVKSQRERIVDATAAIVAEKGLAALTIPEIVRRANVSNQTFYAIYRSKHEAFLGAQKVGMHQALQVTVEAYGGHGEHWPAAVAAGLRALLEYLAAEPAHAHLTLVDTFAANPAALAIRDSSMAGFRGYLEPGFRLGDGGEPVPAVAAEAVVGGIWGVLHHYIEKDCAGALPAVAPQLTYFTLVPFLGPERAAEEALATA